MSMQNEQTENTENTMLLNEIIDNASELPLECQDWLLAIAKAMAFTKSCITKKIEHKTA